MKDLTPGCHYRSELHMDMFILVQWRPGKMDFLREFKIREEENRTSNRSWMPMVRVLPQSTMLIPELTCTAYLEA